MIRLLLPLPMKFYCMHIERQFAYCMQVIVLFMTSLTHCDSDYTRKGGRKTVEDQTRQRGGRPVFALRSLEACLGSSMWEIGSMGLKFYSVWALASSGFPTDQN